jgi:hypothetical protein
MQMISEEEVQPDVFRDDERSAVAPNEETCMDYSPGMLAQTEDELNALRDRVFEDEFFFGV